MNFSKKPSYFQKLFRYTFFGALIILIATVSFIAYAAYHNPTKTNAPTTKISPITANILPSSTPATQTTPTLSPSPTDTVTVGNQAIVPVLMYHYVRVVADPKSDPIGFNLSVTPNDFAAQMNFISTHGYTTITPDDLYNALKNHSSLPEHSIILTFDDGYEDFYTDAFPVLKQYHLKATNFVISGFINDAKHLYLTTAQIQEMDTSGLITIGAHTVHHLDLRTAKNAQSEIDTSKTDLEAIVGHTVTTFAYPSGEYNQSVVDLVTNAGFHTAFTTKAGSTHTLENRLVLSRVRIAGNEPLDFYAKQLDPTATK